MPDVLQLHQSALAPSVGTIKQLPPATEKWQQQNLDADIGLRITPIDDSISSMQFPNDGGSMRIVHLFEGFDLCFNQVDSCVLPAVMPSNSHILLVNYCVEGRCETNLDTGMHLFMEPDHIAIGTQYASGQFTYPSGHYQGIELFIDLDKVAAGTSTALSTLAVSPADLVERMSLDDELFIHSVSGSLEVTLRQIWALRSSTNLDRLRLMALLLLVEIEQSNKNAEEHSHYLTSVQAKLAHDAARIIRNDLTNKDPIARIAEKLQTSPTSLKDYFKRAYGENISDYRRRIRMEAAADLLLSDREMRVSDVALNVGYENQSKFAAAFKRRHNMSPLEYRREQAG